MGKKHAIIIGAGPAGLTAAYYLLKLTDIKPVVLEKEKFIGGLSRTMNFNGNRMDTRTFSSCGVNLCPRREPPPLTTRFWSANRF